MNLFGQKHQNPTVESIKNATEGALSIFRTAVDSLAMANQDALNLAEENATKIADLTAANESLTTLQDDNNNVITNIELLLTPKTTTNEEITII